METGKEISSVPSPRSGLKMSVILNICLKREGILVNGREARLGE